MRSISIQEFELDPKAYLAEAEAGQRLILLRGGKPVVEITPRTEESSEEQLWKTEAERLAAGERLMEMMREGFHLGGLRIENRDELYNRD